MRKPIEKSKKIAEKWRESKENAPGRRVRVSGEREGKKLEANRSGTNKGWDRKGGDIKLLWGKLKFNCARNENQALGV